MTSKARRPRFPTPRLRIQLSAALMLLLLAGGLATSGSRHARAAHLVPQPVQVGTSFSPRRATWLGLDYRQSFDRLLAMHFRVIRLPAYWDEIDAGGYEQLDWLMARSVAAQQAVVLTVGMKSLGWPEFYVPADLLPPPGLKDGGDTAADSDLRSAALVFVADVVARYRGSTALVAWPVSYTQLTLPPNSRV